MTLIDNRPQLDRLLRRLVGVPNIADYDTMLLQELLDVSIADLEEKQNTRLNAAPYRPPPRDGNGGNQMTLMHKPVTSLQRVEVQLPVLALSRVYLSDEIKLYRDQGILMIFTYKLAAEYASLHLDQQIYGYIFPSLPQCVFIEGTWGFPRYDPDSDYTSLDGSEGAVDGVLRLAGDHRTDIEQRWLVKLQEAAVCDAAACILAQVASMAGAGPLVAVSFDGYSHSANPQAFGPQVQALVERRDYLLAGRRRGYFTSTAGGP